MSRAKQSKAEADQITTAAKARLHRKMGRISCADMSGGNERSAIDSVCSGERDLVSGHPSPNELWAHAARVTAP